MSTLHGTLSSALAKDYEQQASFLYEHAERINRFGDIVIKPFDLVPHVRPLRNGSSVGFVAHCPRGRDHAPLLVQLAEHNFRVGKPEKHELQFNDGYVIWMAAVTRIDITFALVFYTRSDAS